jgi:hypothetical protein
MALCYTMPISHSAFKVAFSCEPWRVIFELDGREQSHAKCHAPRATCAYSLIGAHSQCHSNAGKIEKMHSVQSTHTCTSPNFCMQAACARPQRTLHGQWKVRGGHSGPAQLKSPVCFQQDNRRASAAVARRGDGRGIAGHIVGARMHAYQGHASLLQCVHCVCMRRLLTRGCPFCLACLVVTRVTRHPHRTCRLPYMKGRFPSHAHMPLICMHVAAPVSRPMHKRATASQY